MKKTLNKRAVKGMMLAGTLGLCLALSGCYIPPDEITPGTSNMNVGSNNVPFDAIPTATQVPTNTPAQTTGSPSQPTFSWEDSGDNWGSPNLVVTTPPPGAITVVTQRPTNTLPPATNTPAPQSLKNGASGSEVRALQQRLKELGYLKGSVDGDFGDATENAVRAFQAANGLNVDGKAGKNTIAKINSNNAVPASSAATSKPKPTNTPKPKPTATPDLSRDTYLQEGSSGKQVRQLQQRLIDLGWLGGQADGEFGGATAAAVKAFQKKAGLWDDGIAGPDTQKKLYSSSAPKSSSAAASVGESLKEGMTGDAVRSLQKRLKELKYYTGTVDGDFGAGTKDAVIAFQRANGLQADGVAGSGTLNKLYGNPVSNNGSSGSGSSNDKISSTGYVTLREGDKNDSVRKLQQALKKLGYYSGTVDGSYGSGTVSAVIAFQKNNDLRTDGVAGPATQRALYGTSSSITYATIRPGDEGSAVTNLQYTLYELGYYDDKVDGIYGNTTSDAVRAFQIQNSLSPVDGVAGNKTLQKLYSSSAKAATTPNSKYNTLREGDSGNEVVELQDCLKQLGYLADITGVYDSATKAAIKTFQQYNGLNVDGIAGGTTQAKLYSGSAKPYPGN